jgi:hypothetical protein
MKRISGLRPVVVAIVLFSIRKHPKDLMHWQNWALWGRSGGEGHSSCVTHFLQPTIRLPNINKLNSNMADPQTDADIAALLAKLDIYKPLILYEDANPPLNG